MRCGRWHAKWLRMFAFGPRCGGRRSAGLRRIITTAVVVVVVLFARGNISRDKVEEERAAHSERGAICLEQRVTTQNDDRVRTLRADVFSANQIEVCCIDTSHRNVHPSHAFRRDTYATHTIYECCNQTWSASYLYRRHVRGPEQDSSISRMRI